MKCCALLPLNSQHPPGASCSPCIWDSLQAHYLTFSRVLPLQKCLISVCLSVGHMQRSLAPSHSKGNGGLAKGSELAKSQSYWACVAEESTLKPTIVALYPGAMIPDCGNKGSVGSTLTRTEWKWTRVSENRLLLLPRHSVMSHHSHRSPTPQTEDAQRP